MNVRRIFRGAVDRANCEMVPDGQVGTSAVHTRLSNGRDPAQLGPDSIQRKWDENVRVKGGEVTSACDAPDNASVGLQRGRNSSCVWSGDLLLQLRDILLHALASTRKDLEAQLQACGIQLASRDHVLLKRAQFLLYTCRNAQQPDQERLKTLRLIELLNAVRRTDQLTDLHKPCTLLMCVGEWARRAELVGMKPEAPSYDINAPPSRFVSNAPGNAEANFVSPQLPYMPSGSRIDSAQSPLKRTNDISNGMLRESARAMRYE